MIMTIMRRDCTKMITAENRRNQRAREADCDRVNLRFEEGKVKNICEKIIDVK